MTFKDVWNPEFLVYFYIYIYIRIYLYGTLPYWCETRSCKYNSPYRYSAHTGWSHVAITDECEWSKWNRALGCERVGTANLLEINKIWAITTWIAQSTCQDFQATNATRVRVNRWGGVGNSLRELYWKGTMGIWPTKKNRAKILFSKGIES